MSGDITTDLTPLTYPFIIFVVGSIYLWADYDHKSPTSWLFQPFGKSESNYGQGF